MIYFKKGNKFFMKYIKKPLQTDKKLREKLLSNGWKQIKEPSNMSLAILLSIPFMIINGMISIIISYNLYLPVKDFFNSMNGISINFNINFKILPYVLVILLFMTIHEFIHASFIPNFLHSEKIYWGINGCFGFVCTTEKIKKGRYIIISLMPFVLLSIVLPFILSMFGYLNWFVLLLCLINAMGSCVDMLNICIVATQVPNSSYIINNGFETYYF